MRIVSHNRQYDLIVFGATGFTGNYIAEFISAQYPINLKWAIAGRSHKKLQAFADELAQKFPDRTPPMVEVTSLDQAEMDKLVQKTYLFLTAVGPFNLYGTPAFQACATYNTHYVDISGETPWLYDMIQKYEKVAQNTGTIMISQGSMDSVPVDVAVWLLAKLVRENLGAPIGATATGIQAFGKLSTGTLSSALSLRETYSRRYNNIASQPFTLSPIPQTNPKALAGPAAPSFTQRWLNTWWHPLLGYLGTSPTSPVDAPIVQRSWGLLRSIPSRASQFYGPNFSYDVYFLQPSFLKGALTHLGLSLSFAVIAFVPFIRRILYNKVTKATNTPLPPDARQGLIQRTVAVPDTPQPSGKLARCDLEIDYHLYKLSGIISAVVAQVLLENDPEKLELSGGIYTPSCLGQPLVDGLERAGIHFETQLVDAPSS